MLIPDCIFVKDLKLTQPLTFSLKLKTLDSSTPFFSICNLMLYSSFLSSKLPIALVASLKLSLNQSFIPASDIGVKPSLDNLNTTPLTLSVK